MDQVLERLAPPGPDGHLEGREGEVGGERGAHPPAHDHPGEHVGDEGRVGEALPGPDVRYVGHPQPVGCGSTEVPLHQVLGTIGLGIGPGGDGLVAPSPDPSQAQLAHEPGDPVPADVEPFTLQLPPHLLSPIDVVVLAVHPGDLHLQQRVIA